MGSKNVSLFSFAGMKKNRAVLPAVGCIVLGGAVAAAYTVRPALFSPDVILDSRKKRFSRDDNEHEHELKEYKLIKAEPFDVTNFQHPRPLTFFRQISQLENQLRSLDAKLLEQAQLIADLKNQQLQQLQQLQPSQQSQQTKQPTNTSNGDTYVFELSQVIEANNLANSTNHKRELEELRRDLIREHMLKVEGEVSKVENKYRPVINKVKELELHLETQNQLQQAEAPAKLLWISCQALLDRMRYAPQTPLEKDPAYDVLKEFAANKNSLAISVLDSIPAKALKEGVQSEETLIDRFAKVERICKRVALVDERGGGLSKYLLSYLQSLLIINNVRVTDEEVAGKQLVDPTSWNTFDIIARVRYCLSKHNIDQAVRYANQLRGQARLVARDWIRDARTHLETRQAFSTLSTHAEAIAVDAARSTFVK